MVQINSMAIRQIEKYFQQGILNKREVIAILMRENGFEYPQAKQIADYYERVFSSRQIKSSKVYEVCQRIGHDKFVVGTVIEDDGVYKVNTVDDYDAMPYSVGDTFEPNKYDNLSLKESQNDYPINIKSSKYTPDELFNLCQWDMLENTVFLDRDQCKESKLGMSDLIDLLNEVAPSWAGVDNLDKLKDVCRKAKNPSAKARLRMLETAEDNARFTDKFYNSFKVHKQIKSDFQIDYSRKFTLSEVAQYFAALFFDLRSIHFNTGSEFYTYHELAQELYEKTEEYYDDIMETAISFDDDTSPMYVLPGDWIFVDEDDSISTEGQVVQTLILERLQKIYYVLESVQEYDSMVQSKIDSMMEFYDKEIYKLKQVLK